MQNNLGNKRTMAANIKYYLKLNGMQQNDLAKKIGVSQSIMSGWCNANYYPRIDKIERMAKIFGISKADLVEDHSNSTDSPVKLEMKGKQEVFVTDEEAWIIKCYRSIEKPDVRDVIKSILRDYDPDNLKNMSSIA